MTKGFRHPDARVLKVSGRDAETFLQGLITNDMSRAHDSMIYAAILSPQGKYLFDFFVFPLGDGFGLDVPARAAGLLSRMTLYRLRADVEIEETDLEVWQVWDSDLGLPDPRHEALGRRYHGPELQSIENNHDAWDTLRVTHGIPESGVELVPDETFILEAGFERLSGVDFRKGCYVGQEVTARMHHKTELRKGLAKVAVSGDAVAATSIVTDSGKTAGTLFTVAEGVGLAQLRFDRAEGGLEAAGAKISMIAPVWEL